MGRFSPVTSSESSAELDPCLIADGEYGMPKNCYCGGAIFTETSYTKIDPGRRYFTCRRRDNEGYYIRKWWDFVIDEEIDILHAEIDRLKKKILNNGASGYLAEKAIVEVKEGQVQNEEKIAKLEMLLLQMNKKRISVEMTFGVVAVLVLLYF